jgi:hypothetical protein
MDKISDNMGNIKISNKTNLEPSDILKSPDGKYYQILSFFADNASFRLTPYPDDHSDSYIDVQFIILKQALINKDWEKVTKSDN